MPDLRARLAAAVALDSGGSSDFDLNPHVTLPEGRVLRPAGVLVCFVADGDGARLILTKRSSQLTNHPGQIALPGGKVDNGDDGPAGAALREAREEVGLPEGAAEVLGTLPPHETITGFNVTPVVAWAPKPFAWAPEPGEVAEIFDVPFAHVTDLSLYQVEYRRWRGERRHYFTVPYGPYYIWGATARILRGLAERLERCG